MEKPITRFIGCDLGDKYSELCVLDQAGDVVQEVRVRTTPAGLTKAFRAVGQGRVIIEVCGLSRWVEELAVGLGHEVVVANARKVQLISKGGHKTDRSDAELLARLGRADVKLLSPVKHRRQDAQVDLVHLRARDVLVQARTMLINHVRGIVRSFGRRVPTCGADYFVRHARPEVPAELAPALDPVLDQIDALTARIIGFDRWAEVRAEHGYPESRRLTQVPGVGAIVALAFMLTIDKRERFLRSRTVGAFFGITPRRHQSGARDPELRISKAGDGFVRRLLVISAQSILRPAAQDSDLRRWGLALASRGRKAAKNKAVTAVARKLAVLLHRLWVTGERYQPLGYAHHQAP